MLGFSAFVVALSDCGVFRYHYGGHSIGNGKDGTVLFRGYTIGISIPVVDIVGIYLLTGIFGYGSVITERPVIDTSGQFPSVTVDRDRKSVV